MITAVEFPNRSFKTKEELFFELKKNEDKIIGLKKAQLHKGHEKQQFSFLNVRKTEAGIKAVFDAKEGFIYPIISTTKYMDTHNDVHFDGCFAKTVKEQQGKVVYALDHELKFDSIIAWQKDVKMFVSDIKWQMVGKSYSGSTQALIFEIDKQNIARKDVLDAIENKVSEFENSIRMIYIKINWGVNSKDKMYATNKAYWDSKINDISNKEVALERGYFWGVEELAIYKEGSLVVAGGSNDATSIYSKEENDQSSTDTDETNKSQPLPSTSKLNISKLNKHLKQTP